MRRVALKWGLALVAAVLCRAEQEVVTVIDAGDEAAGLYMNTTTTMNVAQGE